MQSQVASEVSNQIESQILNQIDTNPVDYQYDCSSTIYTVDSDTITCDNDYSV